VASDLDRAIRERLDAHTYDAGFLDHHEATAALRAVLDLHPPEVLTVWPEPDADPRDPLPTRVVCKPCSSEGAWQDYPCDNVQVIARALGVAGERKEDET
jgi:hypothetical protein